METHSVALVQPLQRRFQPMPRSQPVSTWLRETERTGMYIVVVVMIHAAQHCMLLDAVKESRKKPRICGAFLID